MTEQSSPTDADFESAAGRVDWPAQADAAAVDDPAVSVLLARLNALPGLPVAEHGEVYAGLHDELAAALNEDVAGARAGDSPR